MSTSATVLGQLLVVPAVVAVVQLYPYYSAAAAGGRPATTLVYTCRILVLQLREGPTLRQRLPPGQARQLTVSSGTHGEQAEGPSERPSTAVWPRQLHHHGEDFCGTGSASGYVLPQ
jgi:hypothetical protein